MEQLTKEQRESLKKTNNERLRARLVKFGVDEELVFTARCTLVQSAVLRSHVVCLSVCLSVCNVGEL